MKTDDPRLEESRKKLFERVQKINDLMLTVLKNHLILEQLVNEFLDASGKMDEDLTFAKKATLCEELRPAEIDPPIWKVIAAANRLRNKIAHTLDQAQIQAKMDELRATYLAALTPTQAKGVEKLDDARIVDEAARIPRFVGRLSTSASSYHDPSLAAFITNIVESDFRYTQDCIISTSGYDFREGQRWWCWHRRNTTQLLTGRAKMAGQVNKQEDRHVEGSKRK